MTLNLNGEALQKQLERIEAEGENAVEASADREGVTAEVSHTAKGWSVAAFGQWIFGKGWNAGGKVKKTL